MCHRTVCKTLPKWEMAMSSFLIIHVGSQGHGMYCHDLEVMSSNPDRVELRVHSTSVLSHT